MLLYLFWSHYPREVLRRAIELHATACVLVHNHPSGDATPSRADIEMTKQVVEVCNLLGISVHDYVIIARDGYSSLRGLAAPKWPLARA